MVLIQARLPDMYAQCLSAPMDMCVHIRQCMNACVTANTRITKKIENLESKQAKNTVKEVI